MDVAMHVAQHVRLALECGVMSLLTPAGSPAQEAQAAGMSLVDGVCVCDLSATRVLRSMPWRGWRDARLEVCFVYVRYTRVHWLCEYGVTVILHIAPLIVWTPYPVYVFTCALAVSANTPLFKQQCALLVGYVFTGYILSTKCLVIWKAGPTSDSVFSMRQWQQCSGRSFCFGRLKSTVRWWKFSTPPTMAQPAHLASCPAYCVRTVII